MAEGLPARCWRRSPSIRREISEETGGEADIASLLQVLDSGAGTERQYFYLGRIASWDFAARTGPEYSQPGPGTYQPEQIPLTTAGLAATDLKPAAVAGLLRERCHRGP